MSQVKVVFEGDLRCFELPSPSSFSNLISALSSIFGVTQFKVKYKDEDGDLVTISCDQDLAEAVKTSLGGILRMHVYRQRLQDRPVQSMDVASPQPDEAERIPLQEPEPTESSTFPVENPGDAMSAAARFDVHLHVYCDACRQGPIVGTRHWCTTQPNFDLCGKCMEDESVDKTGMAFRAIKFPWLAEDSERKVPRPNLGFGSRGMEVAMLQKILTDLGFMTPNMYWFGVGMFGPNTTKAVQKFREQYGLDVQGVYGLYDELVAASLLSILDNGAPPMTATGNDARDSPEVP